MGTVEKTVDRNISRLEEQLKLWGAKLDEVKAKAVVAGQEAKIEGRKDLEELKKKLEGARAKLDEVKTAGGEKWDAFKEGIENTWKELESSFKKLIH